MFESKSPVIRTGAYVIIGFFTLIIIISFGMPDFMSRLRVDDNVVAIINGEKIYRLDFARYRDSIARQMQNADKKEMQDIILSNMIMRKLLLQKADQIGLQISDARVMKTIKSVFKDQNGKFDKGILDRYLAQNHQGLSDFFLMVKEDLTINELRQMISTGEGVSPDEVRTDYAMDNSAIQIKYCYISYADLNKRFKEKTSVTENEIDQELRNSKDEIKDPKTDRKRIKDKLEQRKLNGYKNELINKIDKLAQDKRSFDEAASYLGGRVLLSNIFKIGDPVKDASDKGKMLYSLSNSMLFNDSLLSLEKGKTSKIIDSFDGLYIFSPVKKEFALKEPSPKEYDKIENEILYQKNNSIFTSVMSSLREKSKIVRNLKFD